MKKGVEVYQVESRNPHLHEAGKTEHVDQMLKLALQVIYHSPVCPENLKKSILNEMIRRKFVVKGRYPDRLRKFPALSRIDPEKFIKDIKEAPYAKLIREGKV